MGETIKKGNRQRLRERFLTGDEEAYSDEQRLELLLTYAITQKDTKPIALELLQAFGSLSQVLASSPEQLERVDGIGQSCLALLKLVNSLKSEPNFSFHGGKRIDTPDHSYSVESSADETAADSKTEFGVGEQLEYVKLPNTTASPGFKTSRLSGSISTQESSGLVEREVGKKTTRRKFQICDGYLLEFDHVARVLNFLLKNKNEKKINRKVLQENTGLASRQLASLISIGSAMGLIRNRVQVLTPIGALIAEHDIYMEKKSTLEWCHYTGAGSYQNMIWFEIFNHLLPSKTNMTKIGCRNYFHEYLSGHYSERVLKKKIREEVGFVIDAYIEQNLSKLELLKKTTDERLYIQRYSNFNPLVLSAMLYDFGSNIGSQLLQIGEMTGKAGSPALLFGLDATTFRQQIERLHDQGWLRYETTHNLDQVRLKPLFSAHEFLAAHYEDRKPREETVLMVR